MAEVLAATLATTLLLAGCGADRGNAPATSASAGAAADRTATAEPDPSLEASASASHSVDGLTLVALGGSWPAGAHCGGCRTFTGRYADGLAKRIGAAITFVDLTEAVDPHTGAGQTPESLLAELQHDASVRDKIAQADVIVAESGINDLDNGALAAFAAGTCGGSDNADCFRALGPVWRKNFDAILAEVKSIGSGRPVAIRLVTTSNIFISDPEVVSQLGLEFGKTKGKMIVELLAKEMCAAASEHSAVCVDTRPIINGPALDDPVSDESAESFQKIADALVATGLPELGR